MTCGGADPSTTVHVYTTFTGMIFSLAPPWAQITTSLSLSLHTISKTYVVLTLGDNPQVGFSEIPLESRDITVRRFRKIALFRQMGKQAAVLDFFTSHPDISLMLAISVDIFTRDISCGVQDSLCKSWIPYTFPAKSKNSIGIMNTSPWNKNQK